MPTIPSGRPGSELRDLTDTVSDGDDLPSAINSALEDGVQIYIPPGEYTGSHSDLGFSANNATIYGDPAGVSIDCDMDSNAAMSTSETLRIENIDIRGKKPREQVKIDVDLDGGRLEWVNFNFPDATSDPTDSYVARCDSGSGHHFIRNCYIGPQGNSAFYYSERDTEAMDVTLKGCAFHNCAGPIRMGNVLVEDCIYLADGNVPDFYDSQAGERDAGTPRMFKFEGGGESVIRNTDVLITEEAGPADGPCVDWGSDADDSNTVVVENSRFGNEVEREIFDTASAPNEAAEDSSLSNVSAVTEPYFSGPEIPGDISDGEEPRTDIESRRWNPLSEGDTPDSGTGDGGSGSDGDSGSSHSFNVPSSFEVVTGSDAEQPDTEYSIWTPLSSDVTPPEPGPGAGSGPGDGDGNGTGPRTLLLQASSDNPDTDLDVSFTATGTISYGSEAEEGTDQIEENDDGTTTATSVSMNPGAKDSYEVSGRITDYSITDGYDVTVSVDGTETTFEELVSNGSGGNGNGSGDNGNGDGDPGNQPPTGDPGGGSQQPFSKQVVIDGTGDTEEIAKYEFSVSGQLERNEEQSSINGDGLPWDKMNDYVGDNTAIGVVGNGKDVYRFSGTITSISVDGTAGIYITGV